MKDYWRYRDWLEGFKACEYCGEAKTLTVDHVIPKSRGGKDKPSNWKASCKDCNVDKGHLTLEEWDLVRAHRRASGNPHPFNRLKPRDKKPE
jgi:5-methylcytosine-specific restriction endonuclease McrA